MGLITDINKYRKNRNLPDAEFVFVDANGVTWYRFTAIYTDNKGSEMSFGFWALNHDDAKERLNAIKNNAFIFGQVYAEIPE